MVLVMNVAHRRSGWGGVVVVLGLVAGAGACATPSRRLPGRVVDDPITLPRQMIEVGVVGRREVTDREAWEPWYEEAVFPALRYGLTDRLTLDGITGLEYALLDDAPPEHAATGAGAAGAPLSLSVRGGFPEIGWSSAEGFITSPVVGVEARKRLGSRVRLGAGGVGGTRFRGGASVRGLDGWWLASHASVLVQILPRVALDLDLHAGWGFDGWRRPAALPAQGLTSYWFGGQPGLSYRPFHWLTGGLNVEVQFIRVQPPMFEPTPDAPLPPPGGWDWSPSPAVRATIFARFNW
jgi:hypothetical protein